MLEQLKQVVYDANMELPRRGLVTYTWGNVSGIDRESGLVVIKPSGVSYEDLKPEDLVVVSLDNKVVEGKLNPSSDTKTHLELYKAFPQLGGIVHTHSPYAVGWAQAGEDIPCYGTTHADYFYGSVPCARHLTPAELDEDYEKGTGTVIIEEFTKRRLDPVAVPGVICHSHGPFAWGKDAVQAVYHAVVLEEVAKMATFTRMVNPNAAPAPQHVVNKHYMRKHGPNAYYGQRHKNLRLPSLLAPMRAQWERLSPFLASSCRPRRFPASRAAQSSAKRHASTSCPRRTSLHSTSFASVMPVPISCTWQKRSS